MSMDAFIEAEKRAGHSVKRACELLKVSRAAFYQRRAGHRGPRAVRDAELTQKISEVGFGHEFRQRLFIVPGATRTGTRSMSMRTDSTSLHASHL